jgi:hypothetical protein
LDSVAPAWGLFHKLDYQYCHIFIAGIFGRSADM